MNVETCDKCGPAVAAKYTYSFYSKKLSFCGHCANKNALGLEAKGFVREEINK